MRNKDDSTPGRMSVNGMNIHIQVE